MNFFEAETEQVKNANITQVLKNNILYREESANLNILVAEYYTNKRLNYIVNLCHAMGVRPNIVYCFDFIADEKHMVKGLAKFFVNNVSKSIQDYLIPELSILTIGRAIYAATFDTAIQVDAFYDTKFNKPYFYSKFLNNRIYPVDAILKWCNFGKKNKEGKTISYYDNFEFYFTKHQLRRAKDSHNNGLSRVRKINLVDVENPNKWLEEHITNIPKEELWVAVDSETSGFNRLSKKIGNVSLAFNGYEAYWLEWNKINPRLFSKFLDSHKCIYANGKFDLLFFAFHGCDLHKVSWDTLVAGHFLNEMRSNSLKTHAFIYTNYGGYDLDLEKFKWKYKGLHDYTKIPKKISLPYACMDAAITYQVYEQQKKQMQKIPELYKYYQEIAIPMIRVFSKAEYKGFIINWNNVSMTSSILHDKVNECKNNVRKAFNEPNLDVNSKKAIGEMLERKGYPCIAKRKDGVYKASKEELGEYLKMGHDEVKTLLDYSKWVTIRNVYIGVDTEFENNTDEDMDFFKSTSNSESYSELSGIWKHRAADNKVHTTFHPFLTNSHRHRSSNPNLQNVPKRNYETTSLVRNAYITPDTIPCDHTEADKIIMLHRDIGYKSWYSGELVKVDGLEVLAKDLYKHKTDLFRLEFEKFYDTKFDDVYKVGTYIRINDNYVLPYYEDNNTNKLMIINQTIVKDLKVGDTINSILINTIEVLNTKPAYNILECDGENLQARIAASLSQEKRLINLFNSGGDFHSTNAYEIMGKSQRFTPYEITFEDGSTLSIMEWDSFDVEYKGKKKPHVDAKDLKPTMLLDNKAISKIKALEPIFIDKETFIKNAKSGKLKELRGIAKLCFAKGTEILTPKGYRTIESYDIGSPYGIGLAYPYEDKVIGRNGEEKYINGVIKVQATESITITLEDNSVEEITLDHECLVIREGKEQVVLARDLRITDEFIGV